MSIIDGKRKEKTNSQPVEEQTGFSAYAQERINSAKQTYGKSLIGDPSLAESLRNQAENVIDPTLVNAGKAQYEADRKAYSKKNVTNNFMGVGMQTGAIQESLDKPTNREGWEGLRDNYTYNMDEGTLKKFYSMYGEDKDKAIDYANQYNELKAKIGAVERQENYEQTLRNLGLVRDEVGEGMNDVSRGVAKTMASIGATAMSPYDVAKGIYDLAAGGRHFSQEFIQGNETPFTSMKTDFQNDVKQSIEEASNLEFGDNKVTRFLGLNGENVMSNLYSIGYSTAESMVIAGIGGGAGTILLGTSAGMQTMLQALQQGKSSEKAVAQGLIAGLTEWATERFITLEKVLKAKNMSGLAGKEAVKQYVINQLKAAGAEGSEEFFGSIIDTIADVLINQDDSEIAQLKAEHLAAGEDNPLLGAILDKLGEAVSEGLSGAISGLIMSAGSNALNEAATNASYEREYQAAVEQGTNKELLAKINATEYMNGKTPLTEQSKTKDIVSAYRGSAEAMETNAIKARLVEEGMDEKAATSVSKAIFNKANDYAVSLKEKAQLSSPQAQKVFEEYTKGKENPGSTPWLNESRWRQTEYAKPSSPIVKAVNEIRQTETDELIAEKRKESFDNLAKKYGLDAEEIVKAQPKEASDERWAVAIATAYEFGSAGYGIKKVAESTGLNVDGLLTTVYNKGVEKYKSAQVQKTVRAKVDGKGTLPSQAEIDADPTHYHGGRAITASEMKNDKKLRTGVNFVSRVIAPNISRKVFFYHGDSSVGGERTADAIYINVDAEMDTDSIENGIYYDKGNIIGVFMHEFGHDIRADSFELFDELRQIVVNEVYGGDIKKFDAEVQDYMASRKESGYAVDYDGAVEEIVCDALSKIADNAEHLQKAFVGHQNVAQRLIDYFKKILDSLKEYISSFKQANRISAKVDTETAEKMVEVLQRYVDLVSSETAETEKVASTESKGNEATTERKLSFKGENASLGNRRELNIAKKMEEKGKDSESIRLATGWFKGMDGRWRYEIDDSDAKLNTDLIKPNGFIHARTYYDAESYNLPSRIAKLERNIKELTQKYGKDDSRLINQRNALKELKNRQKEIRDARYRFNQNNFLLTDILVHPALYKAYPQLKNVTVHLRPNSNDGYVGLASGSPKANTAEITLSLDRANEDEILSTLMHEVQHIIQNEEGFARGSNIEYEKSLMTTAAKTKAADWMNAARDAENEAIAKEREYIKEHFPKQVQTRRLYGGDYEGLAKLIRSYTSVMLYTPEEDYQSEADGILEAAKKYKRFDQKIFDDIQAAALDYRRNMKQADSIINNVSDEEARARYYRSAGETESRDVQERINLTEEGRKQYRPDIDKTDRIVRYSTKRQPAPTFYSQMGKVISQLKPGKYDSRSIVNMLLGKGVKAEEIKWSGIVPYLEGKKSVTKEDLEEFAKGSMLEVEDEWLTDRNWDSNNFDDYFNAENHTYSEAQSIVDELWFYNELKDKKAAMDSIRVDFEDDVFYAYAKIDGEETMILKYNPRERATRWAQYTLPYTKNYRELKLKLPGADYSNNAMQMHWNEPDVLVHARVGDVFEEAEPVTDPETGEVHPIFFIEELQSDWHNAGMKAGYAASDEDARHLWAQISSLRDKSDHVQVYPSVWPEVSRRLDKLNDILEEHNAKYHVEATAPTSRGIRTLEIKKNSSGKVVETAFTERRLYEKLEEYLPTVPQAPFSNGKYVDYVMKKLLRTAAEEGYHKIGWTTAEQQINRWSDESAEGYRIEYDQDIPKFLNKYGKQWGAKVAQEELDNGEIVWTFPINEAMRESVVYEGQPMYSMKRIESKTTIKSGSLFSGGGLLEQGLEYALLTHDFGVEINASIAATWKENNGDGKIYAGKTEGDVNNFDGKQYKGKMFHIHASPVCHNLSPAKQGFGEQPSDIESAKKTLQIFLDAEAPVYTVENAELYAKTESARIIKEGLENAGYTVSVGVYDSADYGSPQSRRRTIIRAVRNDIQMPAEPRKIPRTRTWEQATGDMWNTLPKIQKEDIPESYLKAVAKTGIDITNVKEPTLLLQTVKGGTVTYAEYGTQCPTLTTHCDEAKLLLPGGVILDTTPQFLGRLMGLPDDFKYPHFKNGKTKESVAATIIGNGIPVELTKAVIGGVIESAYEQTEGQSLYSIKRIDDTEMTAREYLATATLETIRDPEDKAELRRIIAEYQEIDDRKPELQARIMELLEQKKEQKELVEKLKEAILRRGATYTADVKKAVEKYGNAKAAYDAIQAELTKTEKALDDTRRQQGKDTRRLREILTMPRVETIIEEQRQLVREYRQLVVATREAGNERLQAAKDKAAAELSAVKAANKERLEKLRERMGEKLQAEIDKRIEMRTRLRAEAKVTRARDYYMPRIQAKVKALEKSISKAPIPFRKPAYEFLSMLDFVTRDKDGTVKPGRANVSREAWRQQINKFLGEGTDSVRDLFAKYNIDVDDAIIKWIEDARAALLAQVDLYTLDVGEVALQRATPEQLAAVYQFADRLNFFIKHLTKEYSDTNLDVSEYTGGVSEHVGKLGKRKSTKVGALERFMRYDNAQAKTVFDRLGEWGQKLFAKLEDSADKYAVNRQTITEFFKQWDQKKVREWMNPKQLVELNLEETDDEGNPITVKFTPTQMMALYCTAKDPDGRRHLIEGEGFKLDHVKENAAGGKGTTSDTIHKFTENDLSNLIRTMNEYDEGLIPFADSLQEFLDTVCTAWGNQVSIRRYGFEQFNVPNYFPLFTVAKDNPQTIEEMLSAYSSSFYGMLNRSFTKDRLPTATNALIIGDIVDIFIAHAADMALYNAYGIAVLDVARFLNYKDPDEGWTMKQRLDDAFGDGVMQNYITNLFDSINGQERMSMTDSMFLKGLRLRNRVAVAMNARVVIQQFFSIIRSRDVIARKYFKPIKDFKGTFHEMMEHGPVAKWKNQGNYQNNIKMPLRQEAIGAETAYGRAVDKVTEWGMKPAEAMDNLAWTMIWDACKNWVNDVQPGLDGDAFYTAVNEKFRDVIYRTQVVDSVLQKSQFMRQQTFVARMLSSFKGESTTSYNMLLRGYDRIMEAKQSGDTAAAWQALKGPMLRSFATFAVTAIVNALVVSLADAFRDDDDYETIWEKYKEALFGEYREGAGFKTQAQSFLRSNIFESTNPFAIPWISEIFSILQGYDPDRADLIAIEQAIDTVGNITKLFSNPTRKEVYDILGSLSQLSGFPGQNVYRDVLAMWNSTFGMVDHNLKRQITPESATSGYEALYKAMSSGQTVRALTLVDEIMDNVGDSKKAYDGVSTQIRKAYEAGKISEDEAYEYLVMATEYFDIERTEKQQRKRIAGWNKPE